MKLHLAAALLGSLLCASGQAADAPFAWPNGARAAVSLGYDDSLDSQLDNAIPALNRHGLHGTFYLQLSNPAVDKRLAEWRAAAQKGHELGNHTLFHQCSHSKKDREWVQAHRDLDTTTVAQMKDQIELGNTMLYAIDGRRERTLTTPCGDLQAQDGNYLPAVQAQFLGIKAGTGPAVMPSMAALDTQAVPVAAPSGLTGQQLIDIVKQAAERGTMVNFTFHGIGGDYLTISKEAHEELVAYLAANRKTYWTDTFLNIMRHVRKVRGK